MGEISKRLDCPPIRVGDVEDHVPILARFGRTITQAEWVKELKRVSNQWLQEQGREYAGFAWQGGYADFGVSQSNLEETVRRADHPTLDVAVHRHNDLRIGWRMFDGVGQHEEVRSHLSNAKRVSIEKLMHADIGGVTLEIVHGSWRRLARRRLGAGIRTSRAQRRRFCPSRWEC